MLPLQLDVPMLIHRFWMGDRPLRLEPWLGRCLVSLNGGSELRDWTLKTIPVDYLKFLDDNQVCETDAYKHSANIVRLLLLWDYGGAWYDYDVIPLLPVSQLPVPSVGSHQGLCNSFMNFEKKDERIERALNAILEQPHSDSPASLVSGSEFLRDFLDGVHYLEYPFSPLGTVLHGSRPFAVHLGGST